MALFHTVSHNFSEIIMANGSDRVDNIIKHHNAATSISTNYVKTFASCHTLRQDYAKTN